MSDIGAYLNIYEELSHLANRIDHALVKLKQPDQSVSKLARLELANILSEIVNEKSVHPTARLVAIVLKQELLKISGEHLALCEKLAKQLVRQAPNVSEMSQLELIARIIDKECARSFSRLMRKV